MFVNAQYAFVLIAAHALMWSSSAEDKASEWKHKQVLAKGVTYYLSDGQVSHEHKNLRRKDQQCGYPCNKDGGCQAYPGPCIHCVKNQCLATPQCGMSCTANFQCSAECHRCINSACVQPYCGLFCRGDMDCVNAINSCVNCISGVCSLTPTCGTSCSNDSECIGADGCSTCMTGGICASPREASCVGNYTDFSNALSKNTNTLTICANSVIFLSTSISIQRSGNSFTMKCGGSSCTIDGGRRFTMDISASIVTISEITFTNCISPNNGGAVALYPVSQGSVVQSCTFRNNLSLRLGGAVYLGSGEAKFYDIQGSNNQAAQCSGIYDAAVGSCTPIPQ